MGFDKNLDVTRQTPIKNNSFSNAPNIVSIVPFQGTATTITLVSFGVGERLG